METLIVWMILIPATYFIGVFWIMAVKQAWALVCWVCETPLKRMASFALWFGETYGD